MGYSMVWYDMVWYGMVWYGMVLYGTVWYGIVWYGVVWYGIYDVYFGGPDSDRKMLKADECRSQSFSVLLHFFILRHLTKIADGQHQTIVRDEHWLCQFPSICLNSFRYQ